MFALNAARRGIRIIPVAKGKKKPLIDEWPIAATTSFRTIRGWFAKYPDCNFGLVMGGEWLCLDVDAHTPERDGFRTLAKLNVDPIKTFSVRTPGKGMHHYYKTDGRYFPTQKAGPGLDLQGKNAFCVSPYSELEGVGRYEPLTDIDDAVSIPDWLGSLVRVRPPSGVETSQNAKSSLSNEPLTEDELFKIRRFLSKIDPSLMRNDWRDTIYAAFNVWGYKRGVADCLNEWSRRSTKWDERRFIGIVESFEQDRVAKVGLPRLRKLAIEYPANRPAAIPISEKDSPEVNRLTTLILEKAIEILKLNGNTPSEQHTLALRQLAYDMVSGLYCPEGRFRRAYPLSTGMGKTTLCVALCGVIASEKLDRSLAVFVETIAQANEFQNMAIAAGVPKDQIGLLHNHPTYVEAVPSIDPSKAQNFRFLIACHARAKSNTKYGLVEKLLVYGGQKRHLQLWDESMITTTGYQEDRAVVLHAISVWLDTYRKVVAEEKRSSRYEDAYKDFEAYLVDASAKLANAHDALVVLKPLSSDLSFYRTLIETILAHNALKAIRTDVVGSTLQKLVEFSCRGDIRIVSAGNRKAMIQFELSIDPQFDKVIILDASATIRELIDYDDTIEITPCSVPKDHAQVIFRIADALSSKSSFSRIPHHLDSYLGEFRHLIEKVIPREDDVLVFCLLDYEDAVKDAVAKMQAERRGAIHVLHWGQHRAVNQYADCKWVVTLGVMYLPQSAVASMIIGQTGNIRYGLSDSEIRSVLLSEQAEMIYQGVSRGHCRKTVNGRASAQTVYLFHPTKDWTRIEPLLKEVMPGMKVEKYYPVKLRRGHKTEEESFDLAERISDYLEAFPAKESSISIKKLVDGLGADSNQRCWRDGLAIAMDGLLGWRREANSLVRVTSE